MTSAVMEGQTHQQRRSCHLWSSKFAIQYLCGKFGEKDAGLQGNNGVAGNGSHGVEVEAWDCLFRMHKTNDTCGWWLMQQHMSVHGTWGTNKQEGNFIPAVIYSAAFEVVAAAACMPAGA